MPEKLLLFLICSVISVNLWAQTTVSGTVYYFERKKEVIELVSVKNLTTEAVAGTNDKGKFTIAARVGDLLEFSKPGFISDTLLLIDLKPKNVFLSERILDIKAVEINTVKLPSFKDPEAPEYKRLSTEDVNRKKNTDRAGGINLSLGYGKYKREQAKIAELEEQERFEEEIRENFNEKTVSELLKIKGQELKDFIDYYRPGYELVQLQRPFNYTFYIVTSYNSWLKLPPDQRKVPALPKPKGIP